MGTRIKTTQLRTSSISDVTNTTWYFNEIFDILDVGYEGSFKTYSLSFTSNSQTFNSISFMYDTATIKYGNTIVAEDVSISELYRSAFTNVNYATIEITGGNDATNSSLISWLEANATQQTPPSPSGTNHTHLGSLEIIKKHFGDLEVIKEVLNGTTIYEKGSPAPSLISFTIAGNSYQAEYGMTWAEWVESAYNTDGYRNDGGAITYDYIKAVTTSSTGYNYVNPSSTITADFAYYLRNYGG